MNLATTSALALAAGLAIGCAGGVPRDASDSPYFEPGPNARVVMLETVRLAPRELRAFFQEGRQVARGEVNPHYPNCDLELNSLSEAAREVPPGVYRVTRTERRHAPLAGRVELRVAALGIPSIDGGSPTINYQTRFFLEAIEGGTGDIRALNCAQWGEPGGITDYPTRDEIARALGDMGRLEL
ncbi:MAG: hypothetical protein R3298_10490 [Gammaproteobacteria bacterium]|nr:hypothetical protein [Gammaproteobacteria bacterium]